MTYFIRYCPNPCPFQHSHSLNSDPHSNWNEMLPLKIKTMASKSSNLSKFWHKRDSTFCMEFEVFYLILLFSIKLTNFCNNGNILQKTSFSCSTVRIISLPNSVRKNTEISPIFWCGNFVQMHSISRMTRNYAETVRFR